LENLELAVRLSGELLPEPQILEAIADLNAWMGNGPAAMRAYKALLNQQQPDLALRNKIIDYSFSIYESGFAMDQLLILYRLGQTTAAQNIKLAECYALSGSNEVAFKVLDNAKLAHDASRAYVDMFNAKTSWLTGSYTKALHYLNLMPAGKIGINNTDSLSEASSNRYYTIARLNALLKQNAKALNALKKAFETGFNFGYVIAADPAWNAMRTLAGWKNLKKRYEDQLSTIDYTAQTYEGWRSALEYRIPD
jgi:hypothetical protein